MNAAPALARTGMSAATLRLDSAAHNLANLQTPAFRRQQVVQQTLPEGGVAASVTQAATLGENLAGDLVEQRMALYTFKANLEVIKSQDRMLASLLDAKA
jgi:flagellar hook protein FlgE